MNINVTPPMRTVPQADEVAEKTISDYLKSWGLEAYITKFLEHSIDVETLQMLSEADLRDLVPIIGHRAKLSTQIKLLNNIMSNAFEKPSHTTAFDQLPLYAIEDLPVIVAESETLPMSMTIEEDKAECDCDVIPIKQLVTKTIDSTAHFNTQFKIHYYNLN